MDIIARVAKWCATLSLLIAVTSAIAGQQGAEQAAGSEAQFFLDRVAARVQRFGPHHAEVGAAQLELGDYYRANSQYKNAIAAYSDALQSFQADAGHAGESAAALLRLGQAQAAQGLYGDAVSSYKGALAQTDGQTPERIIRLRLGEALESRGELANARTEFRLALGLAQKKFGTSSADLPMYLAADADIEQELGNFAVARELYEQAAAQERKYTPQTTSAQRRLGAFYTQMALTAEAGDVLHKVVAVEEAKAHGSPTRPLEIALTEMARFHEQTGDLELAETELKKSLTISTELHGAFSADTASSWLDLSRLYALQGLPQEALVAARRASEMYARTLGEDHPAYVSSLNAEFVALAKLPSPDYADLEARAKRILELRRRHDVAATVEATDLANIGLALLKGGKLDEVYPFYSAAYDLVKPLGAHPRVADAMQDLGELELAKGNLDAAEGWFEQALAILAERPDDKVLWSVQDDMRRSLQARGEIAAAIVYGKLAIETIQTRRGRLASATPKLQSAFAHSVERVYSDLANLLVTDGRLAEAQKVLDLLKDQEFGEYRQRAGEARRPEPITPAEQAWTSRYRTISSQIARLGAELEALRPRVVNNPSDVAAGKQFERVQADLGVAQQAFAAYKRDLIAQLPKQHSDVAEDIRSAASESTQRLQAVLRKQGHGAVALQYFWANGKVRILLTTSEVPLHRESAPISETDLASAINEFRDALRYKASRTPPLIDPLPSSRKLYDLLIKPVREDLRQAGAHTLVVSLHGALRYVPLSALYDGKDFLVEHFAIALFTDASRDVDPDPAAGAWKVAAFGVARKIPGWTQLPSVRAELEGIVADAPRAHTARTARGVVPGIIKVDAAFTPTSFQQALGAHYPVVHVASHFSFSPGSMEGSFLLAGDGSHISLADIERSGMDFSGVELLTLSACQTAQFGGRDSDGREVEGLARLAQEHGARSTIASLWSIADESTATLMREFYRIHVKENATKAEALRRAQLELLHGSTALGSSARHPYFWAPFVLFGDWQ